MSKLNQTLEKITQCEKVILPNGLTIMVVPMPQFTSVHAIYGTKFGSADSDFILNGEEINLPAGVAHFLEHKMFENEEGDAFTLYAATGANANAYTSFDKTCYIFTSSEKIDENLDILLSFVSRPHFTEQTVEKEQGIIGQEIKMYEDNAQWRIMFALLDGIYHNHPIKEDIAGSVESIAKITPEMLYKCTDAFYSPQNMALCVAGNITSKQVLNACERAGMSVNQADEKSKAVDVKRIARQEPKTINKAYTEITMPVSKPILGIAFKEEPIAENQCKQEYIDDIIGELIVGNMTPLYRKLYDENLVSGEFDAEYFIFDNCHAMMFSGEVTNPELVKKLLLEEIARIKKEGIDEELFRLCKNVLYGEFLQCLENVSSVASSQFGSFVKDCSLYEEVETLANLTAEDVNNSLKNMLCEERSATVVISAKGE